MSKKNKIVAVIPAFNEAATISRVVKNLRQNIKKLHSVIVVDDCSKDQTAKLAQAAGAKVIKLKQNLGYDGALNAGFAAAIKEKASIIFTYDADGQHQVKDVKRILKTLLNSDLDICVGIRNYKQRISEHLFALYSSAKIGVQDPLCGLKAYRSHVYDAIGQFDSIGSTGTELMFAAHARGFKIGELPITINARHDLPRFGQSLTGNYKIFISLIKILVKFEGFSLDLGELSKIFSNLSGQLSTRVILKRFLRELLKKL